jgi:hypothetical protein
VYGATDRRARGLEHQRESSKTYKTYKIWVFRSLHGFSGFRAEIEPPERKRDRALLLSQSGPAASVWLVTLPCVFHFLPARFVSSFRRRLFLPLPAGGAQCPYASHRVPLDARGFHLMSCMQSGRVQTRATPLEKCIAQVGKEAGLHGRHHVPLASLGLEGLDPSDTRCLDFLFDAFEAYGALPILGDATARSPVSAQGVPHPGAAETAGSTFPRARQDKEQKYGDVIESRRVALVVFACETGGRWSQESLDLVRALSHWKVRELPPLLRTSFRMAYLRRWWGLLSCTLQDAVAASLDPMDRLLQRGFPVTDEIDALASLCDAPQPSRLPPRG